jgi:hypothetical protein
LCVKTVLQLPKPQERILFLSRREKCFVWAIKSGKLRSVGLAGTKGALMCTGEHLGNIPLLENGMKIARMTARVNLNCLGIRWDCGILQ